MCVTPIYDSTRRMHENPIGALITIGRYQQHQERERFSGGENTHQNYIIKKKKEKKKKTVWELYKP